MFGKNRESPPIAEARSRPSLSTIDSADSIERKEALQAHQLRKEQQQLYHQQQSNHISAWSGFFAEGKNSDNGSMAHQGQTTPPSTGFVRPPLTRVPSVQTRYMEMLLHLDQIPRLHNILSSVFTWIILAGFLVVPGTFTTFKNSDAFKNADSQDTNKVAEAILHSIAHIGLLWLSGAFCLIGVLGCLWLWFRWRHNYVWLINRIFLPTLLNSVAGLLTTVVNVYTAQKGVWSVTAKITAIVTSSFVGAAGALFVAYNFWILSKVRDTHDRAFQPEEYEANRRKKNRESIVDKFKRKANETPLQPGSVV